MNAKPGQMVPASGWTGGRLLGVVGLWPLAARAAYAGGYPSFGRNPPMAGLETVTCKVLRI
ncbi:MAG TPA: hypothetical protein VME69_00120 [Methylocella sp.]|nr:hypothetical protein [Methylocella sp.]